MGLVKMRHSMVHFRNNNTLDTFACLQGRRRWASSMREMER